MARRTEVIPESRATHERSRVLESASLKILPSYTGVQTIATALADPRASRLLWLEILVNDQLDLTPWQQHPVVAEAYNKACCWYATYRSLINFVLGRQPLPFKQGPVDPREHRTFLEAIRFAAAHT